MTPGLSRAHQELAVVRVLIAEGFPAQAVSRAYYAAFYAAEAALLVLGETRSKHSGVISAFHRLVVHGEGLDSEAGKLLQSLFTRRGQADCSPEPLPEQEAPEALADAARVVAAVEGWIARK
jgi:uncharacterized protein (UPF0332 family)